MKTSPNDRFYFDGYYFEAAILRTWSHQQVFDWWMGALELFREAGLSSIPTKFLMTAVNLYQCNNAGMSGRDQGDLRNFLRRNNIEHLLELREELYRFVWRAMWRPVPSAPPPAPPAPPPNASVFNASGKKLRGRAAVLAPDREEASRAPAFLYGEQAEAQSDEKTKVKQNQ